MLSCCCYLTFSSLSLLTVMYFIPSWFYKYFISVLQLNMIWFCVKKTNLSLSKLYFWPVSALLNCFIRKWFVFFFLLIVSPIHSSSEPSKMKKSMSKSGSRKVLSASFNSSKRFKFCGIVFLKEGLILLVVMRNQMWKYLFVNLENTKLNLRMNQFQTACLFLLYILKISEKRRFSNVFRG